MKNKVKLKKLLFKLLITSIIILFISFIINILEYNKYTRNFNYKLASIINVLENKYPNITEDEIMKIINSYNNESYIFENYNIDINKDSIILENDKAFTKFIIIENIFIIASISFLIILFLKFNKNKDKEINDITKYIEEINKKNYKLNIDEISEDELSILKNEIYKITIILKEQAENESLEKLELKTSLSDISHQLKTPLTSILIILDNLIDDSEMDKKTREEFIIDIKREINNINFLVQNLLKLSKLDTNTVKFINEEVNLKHIVDEAITKLSSVCDLKNINIRVECKRDGIINTDVNWQVEAISNILKNSIDHSNNNSFIDVIIDSNKIYKEITIEDYGTGIEKEDLPHIFERFYKGKNSSKDSVGIGLALAKTIIEKSNGKVLVQSKIGEGTEFKIRYYKF